MLIRKLEGRAQLSSLERHAIEQLPVVVKPISAHQDVVQLGEHPSSCILILDGWMCRFRMTRNGGRQIFSFGIPGDILDLQGAYLGRADCITRTLTSVAAAYIPHDALRDLADSNPGVATALWRDTFLATSVFCERMVSMGRRSAGEAVAHLFCELYIRLEAVGLAKNHSFDSSLSQQDIGDALGISVVHVNRVIKDLRNTNLIKVHNRFIELMSWKNITDFCDFDAGYLSLDHRAHELFPDG